MIGGMFVYIVDDVIGFGIPSGTRLNVRAKQSVVASQLVPLTMLSPPSINM